MSFLLSLDDNNMETMTKVLSTILFSFIFIGFGYAQTQEILYRTEEGAVYSQTQLDSISALGLPVGRIGRKEIKGATFMMIKIYKSVDELRTFTSKFKGKPLPDITLQTADGRTITSKDLLGKVVMINFWSTTCQPCLSEMPELNRLQEAYKDKVVFLAPLPEDKEKAAKLLAKHPFQFTIAPDAGKLFEQLGIDGYPKNFFINREGVIQEVKEGTPQRRDSPEGEWYVSVYKDYSAILDRMLKK
jgi:thiol-disulfide isomerase/thioredoxin